MSQDTDDYQIVWLVRRLFQAFAKKADDNLAETGISVADRAVMEFLYPEAKLPVPEIATRYQVSRQHVQVTVNRLLELQLLTSEPNPQHKRSSLIFLSARGRALFKKILKRDTASVDALFSKVSKADRRVTRQTLETLLAQLK